MPPLPFKLWWMIIFRPYLRKFILVFFDDTLVYSKDMETHNKILEQFLDFNAHTHWSPTQRNARLAVINGIPWPYSFCMWSKDGSYEIAAVESWPTPSSAKSIHGFLGLTGYYRRFIRDHGKITAPLTALLKKSTTWNGIGLKMQLLLSPRLSKL